MNTSGHTRAALLSIVLPGLGQLSQGRIVQALTACLTTIFLLALNMWLGRVTDRAGFTNGIVNLTCFGPGRIRNTLLVVIVLSTAYVLWRRRILIQGGSGQGYG